MNTSRALAGRHILVVEDEFFIADILAQTLKDYGARPVGPAAKVSEALDLIERAPRIDAAILDIQLGAQMCWPVVDALMARAIPAIFATGYDEDIVPARYAHLPRCEKPYDFDRIAAALFKIADADARPASLREQPAAR